MPSLVAQADPSFSLPGFLALYAGAVAALAVLLAIAVPMLRALGAGALRGGDLALGFAATVCMWTLGYIAMMRPGLLAGEALFALTLSAPAVLGWLAARRGAATPWKVGAVSATVNLLVIGSLFSRDAGEVWREGLLWIGGLYGASIALSMFGGWVAARMGGMVRDRQGSDPVNLFATVAASTVFLLLITGGLVTGLEEGLAVPDWPNTFGHNMLLYPISEMKGGVYYEHVHRLFGTLVGLTTLVLAALAWANRSPASIRWGATALLAAVTLQGLMGGMRVTGAITLSQASEDLAPSVAFAVMHGVFGQVVFAGLCVLAVASCPAWRERRAAVTRMASNPAVALIVILLVQLVLGALYRHLQIPSPDGGAPASPKWAMHAHLSWSVVALVACIWVGIKAMREGATSGASGDAVTKVACAGSNGLRRTGAALHGLVTLQVVLGFLALVWVLKRDSAVIPTLEVVFTTAHQATGALLLASAAMAWAWFLTVPAERG